MPSTFISRLLIRALYAQRATRGTPVDHPIQVRRPLVDVTAIYSLKER
jgi:hypothetical protein